MKTKDILQFICDNAPDWFLNGVRQIDIDSESREGEVVISLEFPWNDDIAFMSEKDNFKEDLLIFINEHEETMLKYINEFAKAIGKKVVIE